MAMLVLQPHPRRMRIVPTICAALVAMVVAGAGCSRHPRVASPVSMRGRMVTARMIDGRRLEVYAREDDNGLAWYTVDGRHVAHRQIWYLEDTDRVRGMLEGFAFGAVVGVTAGAIYGYSRGDDECESPCFLHVTAGKKAVAGGIVAGTLSGAVGAFFGLVVGSRDIYDADVLEPTAPKGTVVSVVPTTGGAATALSWSF